MLIKPAGPWVYAELAALPNDQIRFETIDGELFEMPSSASAQALAIAALIPLLLPVLQRLRGRWLTAPLDVFFQGADPVQPDLLVLVPDGRARNHRAPC